MTTLAYLATCYSKHWGGLDIAYIEASELAAELYKIGIHVYSPITHTHSMAAYGKMDPRDHALWRPLNETMMERCDVLIVANSDGWQHSEGIAYEIDYFKKMGKPIFDMDVNSLKMSRRMEPVEHTIKEVVVG